MQKVGSFSVDHTKLTPGIYLSKVNGCYTYDLRFISPKDATTKMFTGEIGHTIEHFLADRLRSCFDGEFSNTILYVGPMGCKTGFYLVLNSYIPQFVVKEYVYNALASILEATTIPGQSEFSCGNPTYFDLEATKTYIAETILPNWNSEDFSYTYPTL